MMPTRALKNIAATIAIASSPAWADITASATTSGSASAYTLVARVTPEAQYVGRGKLYFVMLHGSQIYALSETRGFVPYTGGEPPEYRTIAQATETITVQGWNTTAQAGASVFVGYGTDVMDMLNNSRFKLVATLPAAPAPVTPPPAAGNPWAAYNGSYGCIDNNGRTGSITAAFTASTAQVDTSRLATIPVNSYNVPLSTIVNDPGLRAYHSPTFPARMVFIDLAPTTPYNLIITYQATEYSNMIFYVCGK